MAGQGCSVIEALHEKYRDDDAEPLDFIICVPKGAPGRGDTGELRVPPILSLDKSNVSCAGDVAELRKICGKFTELDLTDNKLTEWSKVFEIMDCVPNMASLNLSGNLLSDSAVDSTERSFPRIVRLVLNKTHMAWCCVLDVLKFTHNVCELHLSMNGLEEIPDCGGSVQHPSVTTLYLNGNKFTTWRDIARLGSGFPNLEHLVMMDNPLRGIPDDHAQELYRSLVNLRSLNITNLQLSSWEDVEKFRWLPGLSDLRLQGIPLWTEYDGEIRRQLTIAYLPNITRLNGTAIPDNEREDAERAFIRKFMDLDEKPNRYQELEECYGKLDPLVQVDLNGSNNITVMVKYEGKTRLRTVDVTWDAAQLKKELSDMVGEEGKGMKMWIWHHDPEYPQGDEPLFYPNRKLHMYHVMEGHTLIIQMR